MYVAPALARSSASAPPSPAGRATWRTFLNELLLLLHHGGADGLPLPARAGDVLQPAEGLAPDLVAHGVPHGVPRAEGGAARTAPSECHSLYRVLARIFDPSTSIAHHEAPDGCPIRRRRMRIALLTPDENEPDLHGCVQTKEPKADETTNE